MLRARACLAAALCLALAGLTSCSGDEAAAPDAPSAAGSPGATASGPPVETVAGAAPRDARAGRFCRTYVEVADATTPAALADWARRMIDVGTPAGIGARQRAGFEVLTTVAAGPNAEPSPLPDGSDPLGSPAEQDAALAAFGDYVGTTCAEQVDAADQP